MPPCDSRKRSIWKLPLVAFCLFVGGGFLFSFLNDPLGNAPVLDARENLALAREIGAGVWPEAPFYRAILYPVLLSLPVQLGLGDSLPWIGSILGLMLHYLSAYLVAYLTYRLWASRGAAWVAGVCYACYPVALFFSVQLLDITLGISLFLGALAAISSGGTRRGTARWMFAGFLLALAILTRPNFLVVAPVFLGGALWAAGWRVRVARFLGVSIGIGVPLLIQGWVNFSHGGEFRILPWQGAYNLYAANREGADGRYYEQTLLFERTLAGENTARRESEILYRYSMGRDADMTPRSMNTFWREQLVNRIEADPRDWIELMVRKCFYLVHTWEPYNNLSYHYHRARFAALQWNPLHWGLLLGGALAILVLVGVPPNRKLAGLILCAGALYAVGVVAFYVSARFRLPLAPLLAIVAGGVYPLVGKWRRTAGPSPVRILAAILGLVLISMLSYLDLWNAYDERPFIQDEILLASAAIESGREEMAFANASSAFVRDPNHRVAARLVLTGALLTSAGGNRLEDEDFQLIEKALHAGGEDLEGLEVIPGLMSWRNGQPQVAHKLWAEVDTPLASALLAVSSVSLGAPNGASDLTEIARRILLVWSPAEAAESPR